MQHMVFEPVFDQKFYEARTDRNIGWITREEQEYLYRCKVGVAGTGGMGGLIASILARLGIGALVIADNQVFDASNINRQFGARADTIGRGKAEVTAIEIQRITPDVRIEVYPEGITPETAAPFLTGCAIVLDEIEFFAVSARIKFHEMARSFGVPLLNCNTVGFGSWLFYYTPESMTVERQLGLTYEEAVILEGEAKNGSKEALERIIMAVLGAFAPELPAYQADDPAMVLRRLREGKAPIIATNPPMASGFVADRLLLQLLRDSGVERPGVTPLPALPGYFRLDVGSMEAKVMSGKWR